MEDPLYGGPAEEVATFEISLDSDSEDSGRFDPTSTEIYLPWLEGTATTALPDVIHDPTAERPIYFDKLIRRSNRGPIVIDLGSFDDFEAGALAALSTDPGGMIDYLFADVSDSLRRRGPGGAIARVRNYPVIFGNEHCCMPWQRTTFYCCVCAIAAHVCVVDSFNQQSAVSMRVI